MTALADQLAEAWRIWDRWPADPERARTMEHLAQELAGRLGVTATVLRARLAQLRCDGYSHLEAVRILQAELEHGRAVG